jgi:GT2 family glycosyltransferase
MATIQPSRDLHFHFSSRSNQFWTEIGHIVADGFVVNGFRVERHTDSLKAEWRLPGTHVAVGGHEFFNTHARDHVALAEVAPYMVALTGEQPSSQWFNGNLPTLRMCQECWDITEHGTEALQTRGIAARHLQLGLSDRLLETGGSRQEKDLDVFFLGSLTYERAERIAEFGFSRWFLKSHFQLVELEYAKTADDKIYLSNEERNAIAARSKITLNYHGHLIPFFEWHRALLAIANKSLFITDPVRGSDPLLAGLHYVSASPKLINKVVDYFLENPAAREELTESAFSFAMQHLGMPRCVARFLEGHSTSRLQVESHSAAAAIDRDLRRYLARRTKQAFPAQFAHSCIVSRPPAAKALRRQDIAKKRSEVTERQKAEEAAARKNGRAWSVEKFGPLALSPKVSVVVSLFNYEATVCSALDSIIYGTDSTEDLEIIVVDDASHDESPAVVREWLQRAPCTGKLLTKEYNTGFISSRNIGITEAKGEFVAMLDADNAFLPGGLQRLVAKAEQTAADACYGIIVCIDETGRPFGLLSAQSWDVRRLVYGPYVDAMALFRRSTLEGLGFYDNEMHRNAWFGWEDYELWLRLADKRRTVAFVPNFVALYRSHSSSMINATNLFQGELVSYLRSKYPRLAAEFAHTNTCFGLPK